MSGRILKGWCYWHWLRITHHVNYNKAIIVLSDENHELDKQVIRHLPDYMKRKSAKSAIIFCKVGGMNYWMKKAERMPHVVIEELPEEKISLLYSYYCFVKFFDNIVFTHTDTPADNLLGKYLRETDVDEEDAACLALYHLRHVPDMERN